MPDPFGPGWRFSDLGVRPELHRVVARWCGDAPMKKSLADMARSLGLMAVIVAALLFIGARYLIMPGAADRMPAADYAGVVQGFPREAGVAALAPAGLPPSWRANAARLMAPAPDVTQLHIGWALPGSRYAGLDETNGAPEDLLRSVLGKPGLAVVGTTDIGGHTWQQRVSALGEHALTRQAGRLVVVVTGNASEAQLRQLAASLR
jgi:hypothetical protein